MYLLVIIYYSTCMTILNIDIIHVWFFLQMSRNEIIDLFRGLRLHKLGTL